MALQYPHQQPHQVQQQHAIYGAGGSGGSGNNGTTVNVARLITVGVGSTRNSGLFSHPSQHQPILGGGILAISGSNNTVNAAAALNPPMAIVAGDDESGTLSSTTVLTFPPSATSAPNPSMLLTSESDF